MSKTPTDAEAALTLLRSDSLTRAEKDAAEAIVLAALADKDKEIERLRGHYGLGPAALIDRIMETQDALVAAENRGFRKAAEWLQGEYDAEKSRLSCEVQEGIDALRVEADRRGEVDGDDPRP
jgi:hypothetical protein